MERDENGGVITSPDWPENYPNGASCVWTIWASYSSSLVVELNFTDFYTESSSSCSYDYVLIRDGYDDMATPIGDNENGKICGYHGDAMVVRSSQRAMRVTFASDSSTTHGGFRATYRFGL